MGRTIQETDLRCFFTLVLVTNCFARNSLASNHSTEHLRKIISPALGADAMVRKTGTKIKAATLYLNPMSKKPEQQREVRGVREQTYYSRLPTTLRTL
jgi:hypothetical protein